MLVSVLLVEGGGCGEPSPSMTSVPAQPRPNQPPKLKLQLRAASVITQTSTDNKTSTVHQSIRSTSPRFSPREEEDQDQDQGGLVSPFELDIGLSTSCHLSPPQHAHRSVTPLSIPRSSRALLVHMRDFRPLLPGGPRAVVPNTGPRRLFW